MRAKERKLLKQLEEEAFPRVVEEVEELTGKAGITWQIDWASFADDLAACKNFERQGLQPIVSALRDLCGDPSQQQLVRARLKEIRIKNVARTANVNVQLVDGILTVSGAWGADWQGWPETETIRAAVENALQ